MDLQNKLPTLLNNSTLLLDTNFFIDSYSKQNRKAYAKLVSDLKRMKVSFTSISFVKYEFIRSKTIDVVREKERHFHEIVEYELPYDPAIDKLIIPTIEDYKQYMEGLSLTDLILATCLKRYHNLFLLTRDHTDFPTSIFTREHVFNIEDFKEKIYAIYSYKPKKTILEEEIPF